LLVTLSGLQLVILKHNYPIYFDLPLLLEHKQLQSLCVSRRNGYNKVVKAFLYSRFSVMVNYFSLNVVFFVLQDLKDFFSKVSEVTYADAHKDRAGEG
jgi:hypothetical protein